MTHSIKYVWCNNTWGKFFAESTLLSMDKTNAAVFPVPGCDWTIILLGLNIKQNKANMAYNRLLALRGHVTNASFKQWVGILLMPKIDRAHKNYLTPEIWEKTHLREIFYGTLIFQQSSMICIGRHVGGHTLALQHGGQNYFLLISC